MSLFSKKKILVTHNGTFHSDDVFATAILSMLLDNNVKIIRTRDEALFAKADYVYDVGSIYDPKINRFDHHQPGGAGQRPASNGVEGDNAVPYAACGLVWKEYGERICGDKEVAKRIDEKLIQPIDANDNGLNLFNVVGEVAPYTIQDILFAFRPSWKEAPEYDKPFMEVVRLAKRILEREIIRMKDAILAENIVKEGYDKATDKRLVILDGHYPWGETLWAYPEPLYVVYPKVDTWRVECVRKEKYSFDNRKPLPQSWAGLRDEELAKMTGVSDATFCHNGRFMVVSKSKEGALALAKLALNA
jgi:uncharacterized UPF0160 family protein